MTTLMERVAERRDPFPSVTNRDVDRVLNRAGQALQRLLDIQNEWRADFMRDGLSDQALPWSQEGLLKSSWEWPTRLQTQADRLALTWRESWEVLGQWQFDALSSAGDQISLAAQQWRQWQQGINAIVLDRRVSAELIHFTDRRGALAAPSQDVAGQYAGYVPAPRYSDVSPAYADAAGAATKTASAAGEPTRPDDKPAEAAMEQVIKVQ